MRASLAETSADRVSSTITWFAWGLVGAFFAFVAPIAFSSPYPTPNRPDWSVQPAQTTSVASVGGFSLASVSSRAVPSAAVETAARVETVSLVTAVRTVSIRRPIIEDDDLTTGSIPEDQGGAGRANAPADPADGASRSTATDEIDAYLWQVYQRQPAKRDRGGDFTWKDPAAAKRMGKTLQSYVISGMDADFREQLYHLGRAMDAAGIEWTIVSGFRDDWRQSIASGIKARTGYSRHGGSKAVGGYGNGRAVDIGHVDSERSHEVFRWLDANGGKFGLHRPYRHFDPPHVEPRLDWRRVAANLRRERTGSTAVAVVDAPSEPARRASRRVTRVAHAAPRGRGRRVN